MATEDGYENQSAGELRDILASITGELSRQRTLQAASAAEYRKMDSIARQLQNTTMGISNVSSVELANLGKKNEGHIKELQYQAERLARQKKGASFDGEITSSLVEQLKLAGELSLQEEAILSAAAEGYAIEKSLTAEAEIQYAKRLAFENQVNKALGVSGAILSGLDAVMNKLGINSGIFKQAIQESRQAMQQAAESAARTGTQISKLAVMLKGIGPLAKGFGKALLDPLTVITKILGTYLDINKASVELSRLTGQNAVKFSNLDLTAASLKDSLETMTALTKQTGMNAQNIFSSKVIGQAAALKTTMGLTADEAGGLAIMSQTSGKNVDDLVEGIVATTSAFNGANRAAVSQGIVLREVANTSDSIKLSLGSNPEALAKAAAAAVRLGMSLKDVDNIASSLVDFQSSISNELEAELLTGKHLNLEKARELALSNDLVGLGKELFKNSSDIAEFGKMNRIQQEAQAKALGMTRDQLAKVAYQRALDNGLTNEAASLAANVNAEDMKRIEIQANFAKALEKAAGALAPVLDLVGDFLSIPLIPYLLLIAGTIIALVGPVSTLAAAFGATTAAAIPTSGALSSVGAALGGFGVSAVSAIPVLLSIAAVAAGVGIAAAGIGWGFNQAAQGIVTLLDNMSTDKIKPLLLLGPALFGIASGLTAISLAGLLALPAIGGLVALAVVAPALTTLATATGMGSNNQSVGEARGKADEGSLAAVERKLQALIDIAKQGTSVHIDGKAIAVAYNTSTRQVSSKT